MKQKKMMLAVVALALSILAIGCAPASKGVEGASDLNGKTVSETDMRTETENEADTENRTENTTVTESENVTETETETKIGAVTESESTTAATVPEPSPETLLDLGTLDIVVSTAGWIDDEAFYTAALNGHRFAADGVWFQPIYKFDTYEDLTQFKKTAYLANGMDYSYDEVPSFNSVTAKYDSAFFEENTLMLVYIGTGSGSYRYGVNCIACDGSSFVVYVEQVNKPTVATADMAGWFVTVAVPDSLVKSCTAFDADFKR